MRIKRKSRCRYEVKDWSGGGRETFWWNRGDWRQGVDPPENATVFEQSRMWFEVNGKKVRVGCGGASDTKSCRNKKVAIRLARRLQAKGGKPLINHWFHRGGHRYLQSYFLNGDPL